MAGSTETGALAVAVAAADGAVLSRGLVKKKNTAALMANAATMISTGARLLPEGREEAVFMMSWED